MACEEEEEEKRGDFFLLFLGAQRSVLFTRDGGETILMCSDALTHPTAPVLTPRKRERESRNIPE